MDRRKFVKSALAASVAASLPLVSACGKKQPVATEADTSIRAVSLDGAETELKEAMVRELGEAMTGPVMLSGHPAYDAARMIWNGMHDKRPALIAQCQTTDDVVQAVNFARDHSLLTAIRGGGHSWPGKSVCDDGIMISLADMHQVDVDTARKVAGTGGGALLGNLDDAALAQGLVTTAGVVSHTGVGGYTTGGGFGRLNRKYGLTIDNMLGAEIVTADGQVRYVSADNEPDLFWAIRGGGGNFGVVTRFDFQLHEFDRNIFSGMIVWPVEQAREVLEFYADWQGGLSRELYTGPAMITHPDLGHVIAMEVVYNGDPAQGEKEIAPLRTIGKPIVDGITMQDYKVMQTQEDQTVAHGIRSYAKNAMIGEFSQALVDDMVDAYIADPRAGIFTHTCGGAVADYGASDTAFPHRDTQTMIVFFTGWMDPEQDEEGKQMCRDWHDALAKHSLGFYDNIEQEGASRVERNFGPNYQRLREVKAAYDPGNQFRLNSNIEPA
ncbi:MAG: FAD-binding oxidoreductase [Gammaproteobacteria bacterium]|nr:FAD-binding oxidoreductase [Gammaproteobacteria bacterium]